METFVFNNQSLVTVFPEAVERLAALVVTGESQKYDEAAVHFIDAIASGKLHQRYFDDPEPTDCMSFPMDDPETVVDRAPRILGEVFVCPEMAKQTFESGEGLPIHEELALYVIHGLLHLLGYDDRTDEQIATMRLKEAQYLERWREQGVVICELQV